MNILDQLVLGLTICLRMEKRFLYKDKNTRQRFSPFLASNDDISNNIKELRILPEVKTLLNIVSNHVKHLVPEIVDLPKLALEPENYFFTATATW